MNQIELNKEYELWKEGYELWEKGSRTNQIELNKEYELWGTDTKFVFREYKGSVLRYRVEVFNPLWGTTEHKSSLYKPHLKIWGNTNLVYWDFKRK